MTTSTFSTAIVSDDWTQIASGADYAGVSVQTNGDGNVLLAVATSKPAANSDDYVALSSPLGIGGLSSSIALTAADILYARTIVGAGTVRALAVAAE